MAVYCFLISFLVPELLRFKNVKKTNKKMVQRSGSNQSKLIKSVMSCYGHLAGVDFTMTTNFFKDLKNCIMSSSFQYLPRHSICKDCLESDVHHMTSQILSILIDFVHNRAVPCTNFFWLLCRPKSGNGPKLFIIIYLCKILKNLFTKLHTLNRGAEV